MRSSLRLNPGRKARPVGGFAGGGGGASDPPAFGRAAAIMRDRRHIADRGDGEAGGLQGAQRRLAPRAGAAHIHVERAHAVLLRLAGAVLGGDLRREGRRFARALEALPAGRRPGDGVALDVGDGDQGVVECGVHMRDAGRNVLALAPAHARGGRSRHAQPVPLVLFLLACDRPRLALAGARIGVGALAAHRQALAMALAAETAQIHQPLDVHRDLAPEVALDHIVAVDGLADADHLILGQLVDALVRRHVRLLADLAGLGATDAVDVGQGDLDMLLRRDVDACDSRHSRVSLSA